jgi:L-alanine-DL-glutamate epimerase-like enolase superfamily enzyme
MKVTKLEFIPARIAYKHPEVSATIDRGGIVDVIVKATADNGLIGWGEAQRAADVPGIESALQAMAPIVLGRDPWDKEAIAIDVFKDGLWRFQPMTGAFAFSGIDTALWDLCGKECNQPLYKLFGGAVREEVDYFYYMHWGDDDEIERQAKDGIAHRYSVFYLKTGVDARKEERMLRVLRDTIGPERKLRIDSNEAWNVPEAIRLLNIWNERYNIDFAEAPVCVDPIENMLDVKRHTGVALAANEGLWRQEDAFRIITTRSADVLTFGFAWVGSLRRFNSLMHAASLAGLRVCKHCHGEFGISAAAGQHMMLSCPNATDGNQELASRLDDDILTERIPVRDGPKWGRIDKPGLGVAVDEDKLMKYHEDYLRYGQFPAYGSKFPRATNRQ